MILFITSRCNGGCTHCMSRCTEDGIDMDDQTLNKAIKFIRKVNPKVLSISGGEPTLHPNIINLVKLIREELPRTILGLISNGTFIRNKNLYDDIVNLAIPVQVTYNEKLYNTNLTKWELTELSLMAFIERKEPSVDRLLSYGRAIDNHLQTSTTRIASSCFNIRSMIKSKYNIIDAIAYLESVHKFCCPNIKPDGSISLSESLCCPSIGNINDSIEELTANIFNFKCAECKYAKKLIENPNMKSIFNV